MSQHDRGLVFLEKLPRELRLRADGLYHVEVKDDGTRSETWLCGYLRPILLARGIAKTDWRLQLEFEDMDGQVRTLLLPRDRIGAGNQAIQALLARGFDVHHEPARRKLLTGLLAQMRPSRRAVLTRRLGWQEDGRSYVCVDGTGIGADEIIYEGPDRLDDASRGTLEGWRNGVARFAPGNPLLIVGLSLALAAPLVRPLGVPSGLLHIHGGSSTGKSTVLLCAASVFTAPHHVESWRVTDSALERVAEAHTGRLLPRDELGEVEARHFNASTYMLAHERGKARFSLSGSGLAYVAHWELLGLSTGEISTVEKLLEAGIKAKDGQKARILDIPIEGYKHGIHDTLHGYASGRALSDALMAAANKDHGVAGKAMVAHILSDIDRVTAQARNEMAAFEALVEAHRPDAHGGIHGRVRQRFALIAASGEIASTAGITGWPAGTARAATYAVYEKWLDAQGPSPEQKIRAADEERVDRLRLFLKSARDRIQDLDNGPRGDDANRVPAPVAWRKAGALHVPAPTWSKLFGEDAEVAARRLVALGVIAPDKGGDLMRKLPRQAGQGGRRGYKVLLEPIAQSGYSTGDV
jgi:putative DNA primase/helicase